MSVCRPRRSFWRYPGKIVLEFLPAIPPGLPRAEFMARLERDIEQPDHLVPRLVLAGACRQLGTVLGLDEHD